MKVATVVGIRPDFIRMSEVIRGLDAARGHEHVLIHTGQHYSPQMDKVFFDDLQLRAPDHNLKVGSGTHGQQAARVIERSEEVFRKERPDVAVFLGDANPTLASIAAAKMNIKVVHIEGGMRSFDWRMPEEKNRTIVDHISDLVYVYTERYRDHLLLEGLPPHKVFVVGNPIVDVLAKHLPRAQKSSRALQKFGLKKDGYVLVTLHREENVDDKLVLGQLCEGLGRIAKATKLPVFFPISYRTANRLKEFGVSLPKEVQTAEPLGFLDFLQLESNARLIVSDSGTVQEEADILRVPCVVARTSTERPETIEAGGTVLAGTAASDLEAAAKTLLKRRRDWRHRLGDGETSRRIVDHLVALAPELESKDPHYPLLDVRRRYAFSPAVRLPDARGGGWERPKPSPVRWSH